LQNSIAARAIEPQPASVPALGIDFGGTKIEAVLLGADGETLWQQRVPNPGTYDTAVAAIAEFVVPTSRGARHVPSASAHPGRRRHVPA
jgi:fructokinase